MDGSVQERAAAPLLDVHDLSVFFGSGRGETQVTRKVSFSQ